MKKDLHRELTIPADLMDVAVEVYIRIGGMSSPDDMGPEDAAAIHSIAIALLSERARCSQVAWGYMNDVLDHSLRDDEPLRIALTVAAPAEKTKDEESLQAFLDHELDDLLNDQSH